MKKRYFLFFVFCFLAAKAQEQSPWRIVNAAGITKTSKTSSDTALILQLDPILLRNSLAATQGKKENFATVMVPNSEGVFEKFKVWESSNFEPALQEKYPDIRAYAGVGITDPTASLHFSLAPVGVQTMILRAGKESEFIEAYPGNKKLYTLITSKTKSDASLPLVCKTVDQGINKKLQTTAAKPAVTNKVFKTLRLALSCTAEYTTYFGGTVPGALAAMNATMTRVNGVFNKDLSLQLNLIADNEKLIYTDAATDPYSEVSVGSDINSDANWSEQLQKNLTSVITNDGYDIGHLFGASGGGGNAGCIGCVCEAPTIYDPFGKGSAFTSPSNNKPEGDKFDVDYVAHEMGHQLGANHTFSHQIEGTVANVEPGSGSTIMGYAGITSNYDVQPNSDDYFNQISIYQIKNNLASKSCPVTISIPRDAPIVNAGPDYVIPKGTAFVLKGTGSTTSADNLTYSWEQNDTAITSKGEDSFAVATKNDGPLFRSLPPVISPVRYLPMYSNVLSNKLTNKWESAATVARTLHFVLTARDNGAPKTAQTNFDEMIVKVNDKAGPFAVTSQNNTDTSWLQGESKTITWTVNNTNTLAGSSNVNIKLSLDGGLTFPIELASATPNDGSQNIIVPQAVAKDCRILIEPTNNIYYAINSAPFSIGYKVSSSCANYVFTAPFAIPETKAYKEVTITVPATNALVTDVNFNVNFTHAFLSDVDMEIVSPSGTIVKLMEGSCGKANTTLELTFDDAGGILDCQKTTLQTITPTKNLAVFNQEKVEGVWTFRIRDGYIGDEGTLNTASIAICTKEYVFSTNDFAASNHEVLVYPNPNSGNFTVSMQATMASQVTLLLHTIQGKKVFEKQFNVANSFAENIALEGIAPGVYMLSVMEGNKKTVKKIILE
ncbi:reprolysin-like metallopeptidase [Flavobacterium crassostreae]|uniref:Propanediol utilization protein n=1 Tax=Flavobacterium crassostreae TaxID=1763534 RepID=A0A1B9E0A3_9FLAO|nr:zinc-dependent metalloprotease family protein [Flavobacterium crassostreae]OCB75347.1 propanediol utilization protein [Flavobacterium crassostreae]